MAVYLGSYGLVELRRSSEAIEKASVVNPGDVNTTRRRFSFDFDPGFLCSGDQIEIRSTNGADLSFVDATGWLVGAVQTAGHWYVNVDELGGIRLYDTFDKALAGIQAQAIALTAIAVDIPIAVRISNVVPQVLAQCTYFELSTSREAVDITALGDEFRSQYSSLITGSGQFRAFWEYIPVGGELPHYLLQLAVRTEVGGRFAAKFYLKAPMQGNDPVSDDVVWYDIDGVITQAGISFGTDNVVEITADFVTTGAIRLLAKTNPSNKILQENADDIRLEQDSTASLLQEDIA